METSFAFEQNISFTKAANILFNGEKSGVLKLNPKFKNKNKIMKYFYEILEEEKA